MGVDLFGRKLPAPTERQIQTQICLWLRLQRNTLLAWEQTQSGFFDTRTKTFRKHLQVLPSNGVADILIVYRGHLLELEVKKQNGKQSDVQKYHEQSLRKNGGFYFIVHSLEEAENAVACVIRQVDEILEEHS